jgi:hypothetical protein
MGRGCVFFTQNVDNYGFWIYFSNLPILSLPTPARIWYNLGNSGEETKQQLDDGWREQDNSSIEWKIGGCVMKFKCVFLLVIFAAVLCISGNISAACPTMDLSGDCKVNMVDFSQLAGQWLTVYDPNDLDAMAAQWLTVGIPEPALTWVSVSEAGFTGQMSKYETTNSQYCVFLNAGLATGDIVVNGTYIKGSVGTNPGTDFAGANYYDLAGNGYTAGDAVNGGAARIHYSGGQFTVDSGFENHPVTYVSALGAMAFCNYYGWRLPDEWEWQAVADYNGGYTYGCGTAINTGNANYASSSHLYGTKEVGIMGTYGYGMCDMAANVWEWTSSTYFNNHYIRGGGWNNVANACKVSFRWEQSYDILNAMTGFRACR